MIAEWNADDAWKFGYYSNTFVYGCIRALAEDVAAMKWRVGKDPEKPDVFNGKAPLARLLGSPPFGPNRYTTGKQLIIWTIAQLLSTGRLAWELAYPKGGGAGSTMPESFWAIPASKIEPIVSATPGKYFDGFAFARGSGKAVKLREEQVFYYWRPSQNDWRQPESPMQAARLDISVAVMQDRYDYAFLKNDARPAAIVVHERFAEDGAKEAFRSQFIGMHGGPDNAGRVAFVETSEDGASPQDSLLVQQLGLSQRDAAFIERYDRKLRSITTAFGVPLSRLGDSSDRTYSNASVEYEVYIRDRVIPLATELQDAINLQISPMLGDELGWFDLGPAKSAVRGARLQAVGLPDLLKTRIIKINEARHALELDPIDDGDRFLTDTELGLLQNGAVALVTPTSASAAPWGLGPGPEEAPPVPTEAMGKVTELAGAGGTPPAATPATPPLPPVPSNQPSGKKPAPKAPAAKPPSQQTRRRQPVIEVRVRSDEEVRRTRQYAKIDKTVSKFEPAFEAAMQDILDKQLAGVLTRLTGKRGRQMLRVGAEGRQSAVDAGAVFDVPFWDTQTQDAVEGLYGDVSNAAAHALATKLAVGFDVHSTWAKDFIKARANQLAGFVTDTTYQAIQAQLTEGAGQGESIPNLAKRIENLFAQTYANRAKTVARTEVISAYNGATVLAGQLSPASIVGQEWLATPGPRTRPTHRTADGQIVGLGGKFHVGANDMLYPGDPSAAAKELVNCRCTVVLITAEEAASLGRTDLLSASATRARNAAREARIAGKGGQFKKGGGRVAAGGGPGPTLASSTAAQLKGGSGEKYLESDGASGMRFNAERTAMHHAFVAQAVAGVPRSTEANPTLTIMGGGPAAGKSNILASGKLKGVNPQDERKQVFANADDAKGAIPEYKAMATSGDRTAAAFAHEESSHMASMVQEEAFRQHKDIVLDGTGDASTESVNRKIAKSRASGYKVRGIYVTVPTETAVSRAEERGKKTGRFVPVTTIRATHAAVSRIAPQVANSFDTFELWDTTSSSVRVATATRGSSLKIHSKARYDEFVAKGVAP